MVDCVSAPVRRTSAVSDEGDGKAREAAPSEESTRLSTRNWRTSRRREAPESAAQRSFVSARDSAGKLEIGDVDAGDEQYRSNAGEEDEERLAAVAGKMALQGLRVISRPAKNEPEFPRRTHVSAPDKKPAISACACCIADAGAQPRDRVEPIMKAFRRRGGVVIKLDVSVDIRFDCEIGKVKAKRQHPDDGLRVCHRWRRICQRRRVGVELSAPEMIAEHDVRAGRGPVIVCW